MGLGYRAVPWRRTVCVLASIASGAFAAYLLGAALSSSGLAVGFEGQLYLPLVAKPRPTPTPTPTVTPLPPILQVRVEESCSDFRGGSSQDPNGEYVCFMNHDWRAADMTDWRVQDAAQHTYIFPHFVLDPGAIVRLHSGPGTNTATELHWARGLIWNNNHDVVYLYDCFARLVTSYVY